MTVIPDKCQELKVTGWPQLNVYKDGEFVETFKQARELKLLKEYLDKYLAPEAHIYRPLRHRKHQHTF
jgi:thioredoxin domain-containing protein 5